MAQSIGDPVLANILLSIHERWDGRGYPCGLRGEEIPLEARVIAIVEAFDIMTHDTPYRKAMHHEQALAEIKNCAGTQFDPELANCFISIFN